MSDPNVPVEPTQIPGTRSRWRRGLREAATVMAFMATLLAARSSLADHYFVPTGSMIPTVEIGDRVLVNKAAYGLRMPFTGWSIVARRAPGRGDVVVLRSPEDGITLLKRVIAGPGDLVSVLNGQVWINGQRASLPQVAPGPVAVEQLGAAVHAIRLTRGGGADYGPVRVGPDQYLVMGDNRGESHDGRSFGLVTRDAILGKAFAVWLRDGRPTWRPL
jgi:signal peptidase I